MSTIDGTSGISWSDSGDNAAPAEDAPAPDASATVTRGSTPLPWLANGGSASAGMLANSLGSVATPPAGSTDARVMQYRSFIEASAARHGVSPALVAGVIARESSGNANALSLDHGHGKGLMQIDDRSHPFAAGPKALDPAANIEQGTAILASCLAAFPGDERAGIAAYNAGVGGIKRAIANGTDPADATYSPNYVDDITANEARFGKYF